MNEERTHLGGVQTNLGVGRREKEHREHLGAKGGGRKGREDDTEEG